MNKNLFLTLCFGGILANAVFNPIEVLSTHLTPLLFVFLLLYTMGQYEKQPRETDNKSFTKLNALIGIIGLSCMIYAIVYKNNPRIGGFGASALLYGFGSFVSYIRYVWILFPFILIGNISAQTQKEALTRSVLIGRSIDTVENHIKYEKKIYKQSPKGAQVILIEHSCTSEVFYFKRGILVYYGITYKKVDKPSYAEKLSLIGFDTHEYRADGIIYELKFKGQL